MIQANLWQALKIYLITVGGEESFVFDVIVMDYYNGCKAVSAFGLTVVALCILLVMGTPARGNPDSLLSDTHWVPPWH